VYKIQRLINNSLSWKGCTEIKPKKANRIAWSNRRQFISYCGEERPLPQRHVDPATSMS